MPTKKELLKELREGFEQLQVFDDVELNNLRSRARMVIGRVFRENSSYTEQLFNIRFKPKPGPVAIVSRFGGSGEETPAMRQEREARRQAREDVWVSGQKESINLINTMLKDVELRDAEEAQSVEGPMTTPSSNRVFVVHGHDEGMRESVARVLFRLDLDPIILHEQPNRGRAIIEKFYDYSDVEFAVVLLSPDDVGYSNADGVDAAQPRARQNVILELGFFLGKLGRDRVVALHKGSSEIPTDYSGVLFKPYVSGGDWPYQLTRELIASGYDVDANKLFRQG